MYKVAKLIALVSVLANSPVEPYDSEPIATASVGLETVDRQYLTCATGQEDIYGVSQEEIELIALVTMAEAEGESEDGKRLVIDTILNRVDSIYFPDTITDVIYQPDAFESMWNGRIDRCYVDYDICNLVEEELISRLDYEVVFFTAGHYGRYGEPMYQVGNHYFCRY